MNILITILVAFSIGFVGSPSQAPNMAPTQAPTQAICEEDMPCWDCTTMGNMKCGTDAHTQDAWAVLDALHIEAPATQDGMMLSYVGTTQATYTPTAPNMLTASTFTVESNEFPGTFHTFKWEILKKS